IQNTSQEEPTQEVDLDQEQELDEPDLESTTDDDVSVIVDEAPKVDLTQETEPVESRYLEGVKPARKRRRPSDIFYGDDASADEESDTAPLNASSNTPLLVPPADPSKASRSPMPNPILDRPRKKSTETVTDEPRVEETADHEVSQETEQSDSGSLLNE